jgi:thiazole/oxazole-forming peptide maturase SagC family component
MNYALSPDARIFYNGQDEIRIRKGIWNYTEATLNIAGQDEKVKKVFIQLFRDLNEGKSINVETMVDLDVEQKNQISQVMEALKNQFYLSNTEERHVERIISSIFGGLYKPPEYILMKPLPALVFTDNTYSQKVVKEVAGEMNYAIDILDEMTFKDLRMADLTTKTDAIETIRETERLQKVLSPYSAVIGCLEKPSITFLRNLNRLLVKIEKPLVLSMIDGSFITFLTINPPQTGCFECYENRLMARMESLAVYRNFANSTSTELNEVKSSFTHPLLHVLIGVALAEGFLLSTINSAKTSARVVNVYLPVMEIQVQDLLRVPYCPACGFVAKSQMSELFTSSKMIVNNLLDRVNLVDERK